MYIGSVKFFKHLIITGTVMMILGTLAAVSFTMGARNAQHQQRMDALQEKQGPDQVSQVKEYPGQAVYGAELAYQDLYPEIRMDPPAHQEIEDKTVYLTFDDGPSQRTLEILDVLDHYHIKATFFVVGKADETSKNILKEIVEQPESSLPSSASPEEAPMRIMP